MRPFGRFHNLGQHPAHILWVDEEYHRPVRTNARFAQHLFALGFKPRLGRNDVGNFITNMVLPAQGVALHPFSNGGVGGERLQQLDLRARCSIQTGRIDEAHLHPLFGQVKGFGNVIRAHDVAVERDGSGKIGCRHADVVESTKFQC